MPIWLAFGHTTATEADLATRSLFGQFDAGFAINDLDARPFPALRANEFSYRHSVYPPKMSILSGPTAVAHPDQSSAQTMWFVCEWSLSIQIPEFGDQITFDSQRIASRCRHPSNQQLV